MFEMPDTVVKWLAHSALGGGLLLLLGVLLMGWTRRPAHRQRLGELALLSSLLVAGLCLFPAYVPWAIPLLPAEPERPVPAETTVPPTGVFRGPALVMERPAEGMADVPPTSLEWLVLVPQEGAPDLPVMGARPVALDVPKPDLETDAARAIRSETAHAGRSSDFSWPALLPWLGGCYLAILVVLLVRCLIGHVGLHRLVRASVPPPREESQVFAAMTQGWRKRPRLRVCPKVALPVSFGLLRPTILLPPAACWPHTDRELRLALVHELTHLERKDAWSCLLSALGQAVYFYLPWLWWLRRQLRLCQEYIADAAAAAMTRSENYAQYLLSLAPKPMLAGASAQGIWGNSSDLFRRITMLLDSKRRVERSVSRWWSAAAGAAFLTTAVLVSGISLEARADDKKDTVGEKKADKEKKEAARKQLEEAIKAYEALVGEKSELTKEQLRDAVKLYGSLVAEEGDLAKKRIAQVKEQLEKVQKEQQDRFKQSVSAERAAAIKAQAEAARAQAEVQLVKAEAQLQAAKAALEVARARAEQTAKSAKDEADAKAKDKDTKKDPTKEGAKWKLDVRPEFFENQIRLPQNAWLRYRNLDPKGSLFLKQPSGRLGVRVETPGEALTEQLNLAKEQGLVVQDVTADSAAAKAGVQKHDIILFLGDQPVTHDTEKFVKAVREAKAGEPVEIVVLRKGRRVTLKATLAEAKDDPKVDPNAALKDLVVPLPEQAIFGLDPKTGKIVTEFADPTKMNELFRANRPFAQPFAQPFIFQGNPNVTSVITTVVRNDDRFTTRHQEGSLVITLTGTVAEGKAKVKEIVVQDGGSEKKYESLDKVADQYKDKVKNLIEQSETGQVRVKVKSTR